MVETLTTVLPNVEVVLLPSGNYAIRTDLTGIEALIAALQANIDNLDLRIISYMDFWSELVEEVQLTATATDKAITGGNVVVALPSGVTITRVIALMKFRAIENIHATLANEIEATAQDIEVKESVAGTFTDAIDITQGAFKIAAATREGGDVLIGDIDVKAEVDGDGTYAFQWKSAEATQISLNFNDVQMGLRVYFRS